MDGSGRQAFWFSTSELAAACIRLLPVVSFSVAKSCLEFRQSGQRVDLGGAEQAGQGRGGPEACVHGGVQSLG